MKRASIIFRDIISEFKCPLSAFLNTKVTYTVCIIRGDDGFGLKMNITTSPFSIYKWTNSDTNLT